MRERTPNLCASVTEPARQRAPVQSYNLFNKESVIMDPFDLRNLSLKNQKTGKETQDQKPPRHKRGEKFLKGPIPWIWLSRAAQQPGKALHVATVIWFLAGIKRMRTVRVSNRDLSALGVKRNAKYYALRALESAGLISVQRHPGCSPEVTILHVGGCTPEDGT